MRLTESIPITIDQEETIDLAVILQELTNSGFGLTLAKELRTQIVLEEMEREFLTVTTERRLLRWAHPSRVDNRTRAITPKARKICELIWGFIPERKER